MANEEQLSILKQGIEAWNEWRNYNMDTIIDLKEADLSKADFHYVNYRGDRANFMKANLYKADFTNADLTGADFLVANLTKANFTRANLTETNLMEANLTDANLTDANLSQSHLERAILIRTSVTGANMRRTILSSSIFDDIDLSMVTGLEEAIHMNPSSLGSDTIHRSRGKIPLAFLRGCGLSDLQIEAAKLANPGLDPDEVTDITYKIHQVYLGGGIQYYSCFISYNSKNEEFAKRLHDDLQNNGVRCWFAPEDMKIGDQIRPRIDQEIRLRDKLLVILSENSLKSEWVGDEVEAAMEEESKSNRLVLFPIRLDDTVMNAHDDWAAKIKRRRHIGDFSNWRDKASYQKALEWLLRDLKATGE